VRRLTTFTILSLNGCYKDENNGIDWHDHGEEALEISQENLRADGTLLLFGRKTFQEFAGFWPTDQAFAAFPEIAARINEAEKIVFSRSLSEVSWQNSRLAQRTLVDEVNHLKSSPGGGMTLLGSGEIVLQLATHNLIDDYLLLIDPIILAQGTPLFGGLEESVYLTLRESRELRNGAMLVHYKAT
jgi:dihydrofolate reductase